MLRNSYIKLKYNIWTSILAKTANKDINMTLKTKVRKIGGSLALIVPKAVADSMAIQEGDELFISSDADGMNVTPFDPEFSGAMEDAREFMRSHRNAFRELAK